MKGHEPRFVCGACGKQSPTRYPSSESQRGWDVSCAMNAVWARPRTEADTDQPPEIKWIAVDGEPAPDGT